MAATSDDTVLIRQIQGMAVLLSSLPPNGKARELFTLALESPHSGWLDQLSTPDDPDSDDRVKAWLEGLWAGENPSAEARVFANWQSSSDNMTAALAEFRAVADRLGA
jgi:hypothetical protein